MAQVYLNLGSNIRREYYLRVGIRALREAFGDIKLSSVYESSAIGFEGDAFFNMGVGLTAAHSPLAIAAQLRALEYRYGRPENASLFSSRTLDIDILLYDDLAQTLEGLVLPRPELLFNAHVLAPMAELAPDLIHPVVQQSFGSLWADFDKTAQALDKVATTIDR